MSANNALLRLSGETLPDDVTPVRYEACEAISHPFLVTIEFYTVDTSFDVSACLRKPLLLTVVNEQGETRHYHGIVGQAEFARTSGPRLYFTVQLRPAFSALAHREDSRIFQEMNLPAILNQVFTDAGFGDRVEMQLSGTYDSKDYVVQYRESQLNFVSRLMEEEGIFYFFRHTPEGHVLILCDDDQTAFVPMDDAPEVHFAMSQGVLAAADPLDDFSRSRSLRTMHVVLRDYDFEKPGVKPEATQPAKDAWPMPHYEYPGRFTKGAHGKQLAKARMRELRREADTVRGSSSAIGLRCGVPFFVDGAAEPDLNGEFVTTKLVSRGRQNPEDEAGNFACQNVFEGIPQKALFAPPRRARRPRIRGIQTAIVTGPSTDEQAIHTDRYGRIKVRFYWDRVNQQDDTSSCWVRVAQSMQGGSMILPRVGWEVSVAFLEGDPDRPLVLGRVYNAEKTPPAALPGAKASGSIKSFSTPGAGGHNELCMSDTKDSQGFGIHAQKDLNITVGNDKKEEIKVDETHSVNTNMASSVGVDESTTVSGNQSIDVGAVLSHKIGGSQDVSVGGNDTSNAISNFVEKVGGSRDYTVSGRQMVLQNGVKCSVNGDYTRDVGAVQVVASVASICDNILGSYTSTVGIATIHLVNGSHGETVGADKNATSAAAELHLTKGNLEMNCDAGVTNLVGGLHYQKLDGDFVVSAPSITLVGAVGILKGGSSTLKLGGGPVVAKGSAIGMEAAMIVKMGGSLKLGNG
ncbi:MAG: type VI secretion system tip protein VgrG [Polyangiaceae bacterium]|nr:type VI secretion system tip protein VgrG [Polyangiaceae bacterium]